MKKTIAVLVGSLLFISAYSQGWNFIKDSGREYGALNNTKIDGFRPIWFDNGRKQGNDYATKNGAPAGTWSMKHRPVAIYSPEVDRTFFVYGGTTVNESNHLLCMISCYDHKTGLVQRPVVVYDKGGVFDPHDNPSLLITPDGTLWVYVAGRANQRPGFIYKSVKPYDISEFEQVWTGTMAYPQPYYVEGEGIFLFFCRYDGVRQLFFRTSPDGSDWSSDYSRIASIRDTVAGEMKSGHYQITAQRGNKLVTAFNRHINGDCDTRTNVYFLQTVDFGRNWTLVDGTPINLPIVGKDTPCLVRDYESEGRNCYIKDVNFDENGNPIILYLTSYGPKPGPLFGPREWYVLHWDGKKWNERHITSSKHNYDCGFIRVDGKVWTVIAPTDDGPQKWGQGGEVVAWESRDNGRHWKKTIQFTSNSPWNHGYVRKVENAKDDFIAFWCDANPDVDFGSRLYYADRSGSVFRLPLRIKPKADWVKAEKVSFYSDEECNKRQFNNQ